ncbi:MAG TPA: NAD-dependent epimerase/dehydratase family protein, partial [Pyrinomonadaceae bacterium]|nr:NAD-dependent epimerase/dehydratase family protein [Pyrinomonadaceae bacterium]
LLVWELYKQCAGAGDVVWLEGTGRETRDYLHVDDAASALVALMTTHAGGAKYANEATGADEGNAGGHVVVNVASGVETRVEELAGMVRDLVAPEKEIRCRGLARAGDPRRWRADVTRLRALAPTWTPRTLSESLAACVAAWRGEAV